MMYVCPMHSEVRSETPGRCPKCGGMELVPEGDVSAHGHHASTLKDYQPLLVIVGLIVLVSTFAAAGDWRLFMRNFMAGFFLVFSGVKLLDVRGFADGYATYDLLARRVRAYGFIYPFLELLLGLAYLTRFQPFLTNCIALVLMAFSGLGVAISISQGKKIQCACLGTLLKVPLTAVTLVEDFGMAAMALVMLLVG